MASPPPKQNPAQKLFSNVFRSKKSTLSHASGHADGTTRATASDDTGSPADSPSLAGVMRTNVASPQDDAHYIRWKRLAKLEKIASSSSSASGMPVPSTPPPPPAVASPKPAPRPAVVPTPTPPTPVPRAAFGLATKPVVAKFDLPTWEHDAIGTILKVTLNQEVAEKSGYEMVWLKHLATELASEGQADEKVNMDMLDRLLIARLKLDPRNMIDELGYLPFLVSRPPQPTVFEYLLGCWKRLNAVRSSVIEKGYTPIDTQMALDRVEKILHLVISYAGYDLQKPEMFPQPSDCVLGAPELVKHLLSLFALSAPLSNSSESPNTLSPSDIKQFLQDLARRFEPDNEIDGILGPVVTGLLFHESLLRPEGLGGSDAGWRRVVTGLEALVSVKSIAAMITRLDAWNPPEATATSFEHVSLLGPLCRLGVFPIEWPGIAPTYFSDPDKWTRDDIEFSYAILRGTLNSLQTSLFKTFNAIVRASAESREAVLDYFSRAISLNVKRAGMQVDPTTVASDSFMLNLQSILLHFSEPFIDANYTKMDRIDPLFYTQSNRIDLKDETRINVTSEEAQEWDEEHRNASAPPPNFISNIFYLTIAMSHYGILKTIDSYNNLGKRVEDLLRILDIINGNGSWMGSPMQGRVQATINHVKKELWKVQLHQLAYEAGLMEPELTSRSIGFTNFLSTWLIRQVDPKKTHPNPLVQLPLPEEVPMTFRVLPEYIVEVIVDYLHFSVQTSPEKFQLPEKVDLMTFILTFLTSTWYIKTPSLKSKINDVLFLSILGYGWERSGILGNMLNTHAMALKHLMPALIHFYIEVEQTGASSQFYNKFIARRNIAYTLKIIWNNPAHREALNLEVKNVDKFVRFVNLVINDVTYLLDESLSGLTQIHNIEVEMEDKATWEAQPVEHRQEREVTLRSLERYASVHTTLGRSTVELLKVFTAETKAPFMMPDIVDRLATMLDYNLEALVAPGYQELKVKDPERYNFNPGALLADIIQVFLNLSDQPAFIQAVAGDGRSYSKELFKRLADIAIRRTIKSEIEIATWRAFAKKVEEAKAAMEAEEDLGEVPHEFIDPLMFIIMKDPVRLPSSNTILDRATIKSHLLSDSKDPFNRVPLSIEEVIPVPELKAQIEKFLVERRKKGKILDAPPDPSVNIATM